MDKPEEKIESNTVVYTEGGHVYRLHNGSDIVDEYEIHEYAECVICGYQPCILCTSDYRERLCEKRKFVLTMEVLDW